VCRPAAEWSPRARTGRCTSDRRRRASRLERRPLRRRRNLLFWNAAEAEADATRRRRRRRRAPVARRLLRLLRAARRSRATSTSDRRSRNRARAWLAAGSPSRRSSRGGPRLLRAKKKTRASLIRASAEVFWVRGRLPRRRWRWTARTSASRIGVTLCLSRASRVCRAASGAWAAWPAQKSWRERTRARLRWSKKKPSRRFLRVWRGSNPRAREETELLVRRRRTAEAGVARRRACSR